MDLKNLLLMLSLVLSSFSLEASNSLSYSGRLVNADGSPVTGPVNLKFELAYTNSSGVGPTLCDQLIEEVPLSNGVFHIKLNLNCSSSSLTRVLSSTPAGDSAAIRVTNETSGKTYPYQSLHPLPYSQVSNQLTQMGAVNGQVLTWNGSEWAPANGATADGTVKSILTGSGLIGGPITDSGTISIAPGGVLDTHLAYGIDPAKLSGTRDNSNYLKGDNTWSSFSSDVLETILTGFSTATSAVVNATDTLVVALGKIQAQLTNKIDKTGGTLSIGTIDGVPTPVLPSQIVNKQYVDDAIGGVDSSLWTTAVNDIFYNTGNVGIGTSTPASKLDVSGGVQISKANTHLVLKDTDEVAGEFAYIERNSTALIFGTNDGATSTIGLTVKDGNVEVAGQVKITGGTPGVGKILTSDASGLASWTDPTSTTPTGAAGGDLSGTYPDPIIASGAITDAKVAAGANIDQAKIAGLTTDLGNKQTSDSDLTALAGLGTTGVLVRTGTGTATTRSIIGTTNRVSVTNGDGVSGDPTINISSTLLPSPVAGDAGKILKGTGADTTSWESLLSSDVTTALGFTPINKAGDSITSGVFDFSGTAFVRVQDPVLATDAANKQYVDDKFSTGSNQWSESGGDVYRPTGNVGIGTATPTAKLDVNADIKVNGITLGKGPNGNNSSLAFGVNALATVTTGAANIAIGKNALMTGQASYENIAIGNSSQGKSTTGNHNITIGHYSMEDSQVTGSQNVAIGNYSMAINETGNSNTAIGTEALNNNWSGSFNTGVGRNVLIYNSTGNSNTAVGFEAGMGVSALSDYQNNTLLGYQAGRALRTAGSDNILLGYKAGDTLTTGAKNILIGYDIDMPTISTSNTLNIGNMIYATGVDGVGTTISSGNVGIGTTTPSIKLDVAGAVRVGTDGTACAAGIAGAIRYNGGNVEYCNGTAWTAFAASGSGITSVNGLTAGTQTFAIGTSGTAPAFNSATSTHTLDIPIASAAGVTAGLLSKTDYDAFNGKLGTTLNSGNIWVGNGSNVATAVAPSSDVSMTNAGAFTVTKLQGKDVSTTAPVLGSFLKWDNLLSQWAPSLFTNCNGTTEVLRYTLATDTWTCDTLGINNLLPAQTANSGKVLTTDGTTASWQTPSGNMSGSGTTNYLPKFTAASTLGDSLVFDNGTNVGIGTTTPARILHVNGPMRLTPSTTPASPAAGDIFIDSAASNTLKFYNGSSWASASGASNIDELSDGKTTASSLYLGASVGAANTGGQNTAVGIQALQATGNGGWNSAFGNRALNANTSGFQNNAFGNQALQSNTTGSSNSAFGKDALRDNSTGTGNTVVGDEAFRTNTSGFANSVFGYGAAASGVGTRNYSTIMGAYSGTTITGDNNIIIGANSGNDPTNTGRNSNILIGYNVEVPAANTDNYLNIGNTIYGNTSLGNVGIGTTTPATMLDVAGSIRPGADASPCVAGLTGAIRNNAGVIEFCNGTAWTAFASGSTGDFLKDGSVAMTGPFKAAGGTPAAPGITFGADPDTGISNQAANTLTFSVAGTEKFTVSSAGVYTSGATLLQSWKVASQSNDNSSYTPSSISSKVPLTTGFVKAENVSAGNNKMAMFELAVTNTDSTVQNAYFGAFANGSTYTPSIVIGQQTGATAYDERMRIDASGNVGIGTTTPATMLDVAGAIRPGADISLCVAGLTGAIRNNVGVIEFCNGTAWTAFATAGSGGDFMKDGSVAMTGAFKAANGTAAAPSISFSSETNTGFYYKNATEVGWSVTGGLRFNFGTNIVSANTGGAGITSANGTATNAAFFFQGDANTGMFSPALETLGFTTNGAEKMRITSTGNVGIGTTTPGAALHVASGSSSQSIIESLVSYNLNPVARLSFQNKYDSLGNSVAMGDIAVGKENATDGNYASFMALRTRPNGASPQERMRISSAGNVGIGTTTPATMLDVAGAIRPGADISPCVAGLTGAIRNNAGVIEFCNGTAWTAFATGVASSGTNTSVQISDGSGGFTSSTWFNYTSGKLGIGPGTTAPTNSLTVIDSGANAPIAKFQNGDSRGAGIEVKATGTGGADFWIQATADNATEGGGKLSFRDRLAADASRMVINSVGNVGIGTTSPLAKMDVNGEIVTSSGGAVVGRMRSLNLETAPVYAFSGGNTGMWAPTTTSLGFSTDGVEKMRITQNGDVGIKTTTPSATLDVNGVATMNASTESITTYSDTGTAYTIPNSLTNIRRLTLTGNATVTLPSFFSATPKVFTLTVFLKQDATGNRTVSFIGSGSDTVKWDSGTAPSIATTASKITIVQFTKPSDETVWYASKVWQE